MTNRLMTAKELKLSQAQYCGLVKTLEALESDSKLVELGITFDMATWSSDYGCGTVDYGCGTVCCIGGTAEFLGKCAIKQEAWKFDVDGERVPLHYLFYPEHVNGAYSATAKQAAVALRHYLMTGKENWKMAMETPR